MTKPYDNLSRIRFLTISLFLSGSFNILLIALHFYWALQEKPTPSFVQLKPKIETKVALNEELLRHFRTLSLDTLITKLSSSYDEERDIALATLVAYYDFDIKRALCSSMHPLSPQLLVTRSGQRLHIFPNLQEEQIKLIQDFAKKEKWPLKAKGLFSLLKQGKQEATLFEAFYLTDEFALARNLFAPEISSSAILQILLEGPWELLVSFFEKQKKSQAISNHRPYFLFEYVKNGSKSAAKLFLRTDWDFIITRLKDDSLMTLLKMLERPDDLSRLAMAITTIPRGEALRSLAQKILSESGRNNLQEKVLTKLKSKDTTLNPLFSNSYIVQEGDSLWKISRKFQVDVENLKKTNALSSDVLQPGTALQIPSST